MLLAGFGLRSVSALAAPLAGMRYVVLQIPPVLPSANVYLSLRDELEDETLSAVACNAASGQLGEDLRHLVATRRVRRSTGSKSCSLKSQIQNSSKLQRMTYGGHRETMWVQ